MPDTFFIGIEIPKILPKIAKPFARLLLAAGCMGFSVQVDANTVTIIIPPTATRLK